MHFSRLRGLVASLLLGLTLTATAEVAVPPLTARVTDLSATLSAEQRTSLENTLQAIETRNGSQIAVLLVPTTLPEAIEQYSIRVVEAWKLGHKGVDNGLLLIVAKNDRKVRIEIGYGLEGVIPDAIAKRVVDESITPRFKEGDFAGGITAGVQRLADLIDGRQTATDTTPVSEEAPSPPPPSRLEGLIHELSKTPAWLLIALVIVGTALRAFLGPFFGGLTTGGLVSAGAWFVSGAVEVALLAGAIAFVFILVGLANWLALGLGGFSGSSGGGSSGGGGFSGGGGGFGGGGASGSW